MTSRMAVMMTVEICLVSVGGADVGEDLGGSNKYSNKNFSNWSGEGFHVCTEPLHVILDLFSNSKALCN